jgi:hypothetical protein
MLVHMRQRTSVLGLLAVLALAMLREDASARTTITVWVAAPAQAQTPTYGGATYGTVVPTSGALIAEQRDVDIDANGDARVTGVAATIDPTSVRLRAIGSIDSGEGVQITQQRFIAGATTPDEILARHVGDTVTVVTAKGELTGVLRASDAQAIVVEVGTGERRQLQVLRRDGYVLDVRLSARPGGDKPTLAWRVAAKKPGKHAFEIVYRADAMSWTADYVAVLDDASKTLDFAAWATIKNGTGASFDDAELTLVSGGGQVVPAAANGYQLAPRPTVTPQLRFVVPSAVRLGVGETVQVELAPPRVRVKPRSVVTYEAMPDPAASPGFTTGLVMPMTDCNMWNSGGGVTGRAEATLELDAPAQLPDGRVRLFRRRGDRLELASEDQLRGGVGIARINLSPDGEIAGERHATCLVDERAKTIREKIEIKVENKGKQAADVVVREFLWRWPQWKIDPADESMRGARAGAQTQEYRVNVPGGGRKTLSYTVVYSW